MIGIYMALSAINELDATERYRHNIGNSEQLAEYLGTIENGQTYGSLVGDRASVPSAAAKTTRPSSAVVPAT